MSRAILYFTIILLILTSSGCIFDDGAGSPTPCAQPDSANHAAQKEVLINNSYNVEKGMYRAAYLELQRGDQLQIDVSANDSFNFLFIETRNFSDHYYKAPGQPRTTQFSDISDNGIVRKTYAVNVTTNSTYLFVMDNSGWINGSDAPDHDVSVNLKVLGPSMEGRPSWHLGHYALYGKITINGEVPKGNLLRVEASGYNTTLVDSIGRVEVYSQMTNNSSLSVFGQIDPQGNYYIGMLPGNSKFVHVYLYGDMVRIPGGFALGNSTSIAIIRPARVNFTQNATRCDIDITGIRMRARDAQGNFIKDSKGIIIYVNVTPDPSAPRTLPIGDYESDFKLTMYD